MWELDHKEGRVPENWCFWTVVLEKPLGSPWESKEIKWVNPKENQPWILFGRTDAEAEASILCPPEEPTHWKRHWCWERLKPREDGDNRGWDGWMASPIRWTWTWASFGRRWGTGNPGMLQSMGSQRVRHDLVTEQQQLATYGCGTQDKVFCPLEPQCPWLWNGETAQGSVCVGQGYISLCLPGLCDCTACDFLWSRRWLAPSLCPLPRLRHSPPSLCEFSNWPSIMADTWGTRSSLVVGRASSGWCGRWEDVQDEWPCLNLNPRDSD